MADLISVMIVDDEKLTLEDLSTIVDWEACGYKIVATVFNGKQALRKYRELHPQLILTDIRMPFMDGIEMISEIRKTDQKVSIVLLTAYEEFGYAKAAISLGITEYLIKSEITAASMTALLQRLSTNIIQQDRKNKILTDVNHYSRPIVDTIEFNLGQDLLASQTILDSGVPLVPTPILTDDIKWGEDPNRHPMRLMRFIYRDAVLGDMFSKLQKAPK